MANNNTPSSAEQYAYDIIKTRILNMDYPPGEFISDSEVAAELELSRTPVLYALRYLEYEGLVTRQPRRGWQICGLSLDDIHDIFNIKEALGVMIVCQAAQCTNAGLRQALQDACHSMIVANEANDLESWETAHREWHMALNAMTHYPDSRTFRILDMVNDQWRRVRNGLLAIEGRMDRETLEHCTIAESVLAGDQAQSEAKMRSHLQSVRSDIVNLLTSMVLPFAPHGV